MARSIAQIQAAIVAAKNADPVLGPLLTSISQEAVWWCWTWVIATCQWVTESAFDSLVALVNSIIAAMKPHTLQWYVTKAKLFQYGYLLPADTDVYNPLMVAPDASLVVAFAAAVELENLVRIKVAASAGGVLGPLTAPQLSAFTAYMKQIKDAGVRVQCTSGPADNWQLSVNVYYDPLILDNLGRRLDGTENTPVLDGMNAFVEALPFNGVFSANAMIAAGQAISGVVYFDVDVCQATYALVPYTDILTATPNIYTPDAGYMKLDSVYFNAHVTYIAAY